VQAGGPLLTWGDDPPKSPRGATGCGREEAMPDVVTWLMMTASLLVTLRSASVFIIRLDEAAARSGSVNQRMLSAGLISQHVQSGR
jgi:hypothetical protein